MVNYKFYKTIFYGTFLLHFGLTNAIKTNNEKVWVECTPMDNGTFYPHPDCSKYYECVSGQLFTRDCSPGTYFNLEINQCDYPYNVPECEGGTRPPETSSPAPSSTTGVPLTTSPISISTITTPTMTSAQTTTNTTKDETTPIPNWCPMEGEAKIQNPGSCISYLTCIDGALHVANCTNGLHFNPSTKECDLPENVNCKGKSTTKIAINSTTATDTLLACPSNPSIYLPHPLKFSQYYLCEYGVLQALFSCSNNYKFDFLLQICKISGDSES